MGEGEGGGERDCEYSSACVFPPPLYPLPPGEGKVVVGQAHRGDFIFLGARFLRSKLEKVGSRE